MRSWVAVQGKPPARIGRRLADCCGGAPLSSGPTITEEPAHLDHADKALPHLRLMAAHGASIDPVSRTWQVLSYWRERGERQP